MAKQFVKPMKPATTRRRRAVEVSDGVRVIMAGLNPAEKDAIEAVFRSAKALLGLPVDYAVNAPSGVLRVARATKELRLVYRVGPTAVHVTDLLSAGAVRYLLRPAWTPRAGKTSHAPPKRPSLGKRPRRPGATPH